MKWKKLGRIYCPQHQHQKLHTHAANPLAVHLAGNVFRVFYSGRDAQNRSSVSFVDIDVLKLSVVYSHPEPVFEHGAEDSFYSHGVSIGNIYKVDGVSYILFMGWKNLPGEHWWGQVGRLRLDANTSIFLDPETPFMTIDEEDPISMSYPWVLLDRGVYKMWYGSTTTWDVGNGEMEHLIKYATSLDGNVWQKHGQAIPCQLGVAQAFSRPTVISDENGYHMWFSYRGRIGVTYRIGYAFSRDGVQWENRLDETGIDVSDTGWDSEMIEYPFVFDHDGSRFMLYNGNGNGKTGFGLAIQEN
jgi:hypothetical protein